MLILGLSFTFVCTLVVALIYAILYLAEKEKSLLIWSVSWGVYSLRFLSQLGMVHGIIPPWFLIVQQSVTLASGLLFWWGACRFFSKPFHWGWLLAGVTSVAWTSVCLLNSAPFLLLHLPTAILLGIIFVRSGLLFFKETPSGPGRYITGSALVLWGFHKANYPFLRPLEWFAPWGFIIAAILFIATGIGIILVYQERLRKNLNNEIIHRRKEEERFRSIVESTSDAIVVADSHGLLVMTNSSAQAMFGYTAQELIGMSLTELMPVRYRNDHQKGMARLSNTGQNQYIGKPLSFFGLKKDGSEFPLDLNVAMWKSSGEVYFSGILRNMTTLRNIEQNLAIKNAQLVSLIDSIPDLIFYKDTKSVYLGCNDAFAQFVGKPKEEIIGNTDFALFPHDVAEYFQGKDKAMLASVTARSNEEWVTYPDGRKVLLDTIKTPYYDQKHTLLGLIGISRDITEKKIVEEQLASSVSLLNELGTIARIGGWEMDLATRKAKWTDATFEIVEIEKGMPPPGLDEHVNYYLPEFRPLVADAMRALIEEDKPLEYEAKATTAKGNIRWYRVKGLAERDENGNCIRVYGTIQDISDRKKAEKELSESEVKFRVIFDSVLDGILVADITGKRFLTGNEAICKMLGYSQEEIVSLGVADIHPKKSLQYVMSQFEKQARGEIAVAEALPIQRKDGSVFYADVSAAPFTLDDNEFTIGVFRDISEKIHVEEKLRQSQKMEAIGTLAGGIAHDFNNILVPILGYTEMVMNDVGLAPGYKKDLHEVYRAATRARDLVKQILTFSRQSEHENQPLLVSPVVKECLKLIQSSTPTTIKINKEFAADYALVFGDPTNIHQIAMNLCTNAIYAMREHGGTLTVSLSVAEPDLLKKEMNGRLPVGRYARLRVEDTGCGIEKENLKRIFDPYFTTKPKGEGTGLGLSVIHGIVKKSGGEILVDSVPGKGTAFTVYLPLYESTEDAGSRTSEPPAIPMGNNEEILIVDDEAAITALQHKVLESLNYRVTSLTNSKEAFELFKADPNRFAVVITDQTMPHMTGDQLAREILAIRPDIPIIISTGFSSIVNEEGAREIGIKKFLFKPVDRRDIAEALHDILVENNQTH